MKKVFSILMVALFATAMMSCQKENVNEGNGSQTEIAKNTLVYDGTTYTFSDVVVTYYHSQLTLMFAFTGDTLENGQPRLSVEGIHIVPSVWNKTLDLASYAQYPEDATVTLNISGEVNLSYEAWDNGGMVGSHGILDGQEYENESIFTSGTYNVSGNNDGTPITVTVDGKLKNGKTLKMKIVSDNYNL